MLQNSLRRRDEHTSEGAESEEWNDVAAIKQPVVCAGSRAEAGDTSPYDLSEPPADLEEWTFA